MRYVSYLDSDQTPCWGVVTDSNDIVSSTQLGLVAPTLKKAIASGELASPNRLNLDSTPTLRLDEVQLQPVIPDFGAMYCTGLNYSDHARESGKEAPSAPRIFVRLQNSLVGHDQSIIAPTVSEHFDYEGELAVVIGRSGRHIPEEEALAHVFGYTCFMDGSVRDWQKITTTLGKNFEHSGALGPAIMPASHVPDVQALTLTTRLNGRVVQQANTRDMIFSVAQLISFVSTMITLQPGDIIATGTPDGVGQSRNPPLWLKIGDDISVTVDGLGTLANRIDA
ncbi:FAA hydrolase family protein [Natronospirillum operosum]|uniref:FAA hydrolase family protein n=1 Tax=Natronospirillum operosum TaxID=2759953 RepID=A0A4Z0W6Y0_9GAMM|nr:fumarylacetoacetate hydrolase family protein [Natronospirillum operosum]TGG93594.1 FAA hydrolase family protein [Natronospirillum operosum]